MKKITIKQLQKAVNKAPKEVHLAGKTYIRDGVKTWEKNAKRKPWRVGMSGGGIPVRTGELKKANESVFNLNKLEGRFKVNENRQAPREYKSKSIKTVMDYAVRVHKKRPWMDWTEKKSERELEKLESEFANEILKIIAT